MSFNEAASMDVDIGTHEHAIRTLLHPSNDTSTSVRLLKHIVRTPAGREQVLCLQGSEAEQFLTLLHEVVNSERTRLDEFHKTFLRVMIELAKRSKCLPSTLLLSNIEPEPVPIGAGASGTVHKGRWLRDDGEDVTVAVKILRFYTKQSISDIKREQQFYEEVLLWRHLSNKHILPFLGIFKVGPQLAIVSEYQSNGNLTQYVDNFPRANKYKLLMEATSGLIYLHEKDVIHRDLKGPNILIGNDGSAMLADFGYSRMKHDLSEFLSSNKDVGTINYMSPELLRKGSLESSKYSDIWALGMVIYEVFSRTAPFSDIPEIRVLTAIMDGELPSKPKYTEVFGFTEELWQFLKENCWATPANHRPSATDCLCRLEQLSQRWGELEAARATSSQQIIEISLPMEHKHAKSLPLATFHRLGVTADVRQNCLTLRGDAFVANALKSDICSDIANRENWTTDDQLIIPPRFHDRFIGKGGESHKRLQDKYAVKIHFERSSGNVSISGLLSNITRAKAILQSTKEQYELHDDIRHVEVDSDTMDRVLSDRAMILSRTELKSIKQTKRGVSDVLELRGPKKALEMGEQCINELKEQLRKEITVYLDKNVSQMLPFIVGDKLTELMVQCNGPNDRNIQKRLVRHLPDKGVIRLRGERSFVKNLQRILEIEAERSREIIIGMYVSHRRHSDLRREWYSAEFPQRTHTLIDFPGGSTEHAVFVGNDPENLPELEGKSPNDIIRIYGTRECCEKAVRCLEVLCDSQRKLEKRIRLPKIYHHDVYRIVNNNLAFKELGVIIDFYEPPPTPLRPSLPSDTTWKIFRRYDPEDKAEVTWYLKAPTEAAIEEGIDIIRTALGETSAASRIALLAFRDSSNFGLIVGAGGETLREIQAESNTSIDVPKIGDHSSTITIIGSTRNVETARDLILTAVAPKRFFTVNR